MATTESPALTQLLAHLHSELQMRCSDVLLCGFCHAPIVRIHDTLPAGENQPFRYVDSDGIPLQVGCYRQAPGCDIVGQAVPAPLRFRGFSQQLAVCGDCNEHLGWHYQRGEQRDFFGLILDKLIRAGANGHRRR